MLRLILLLLVSIVVANSDVTRRVVRLTSSNQIKYFSAPLAREPIQSWIDIQQGIYPNVKPITDVVDIGENITLFIYFKEPNNLYDISITDCWAFDNDNPQETHNRISLYDINDVGINRQWKKIKYYEGDDRTIVMFTNLRAFKFPDTEKVFLNCNISVCYRKCTDVQHAKLFD